MSKSSRCLVLGANGFIGSHLVDELVEKGFSVIAFDRFSSNERYNDSPKIKKVKASITDYEAVKDEVSKVDYVFHCVSATTPFISDQDPYSDVDKNLKVGIKIFEICADAKIKKLIFISSGGAIYGHIAEIKPATEDDVATPVSPYGICKLALEHYLAYFSRTKGLQYCSMRLTNPYGPRQEGKNHQGVIPIFIKKIRDNETIEVYGDGSGTRDYIYIRDATNMIVGSFSNKSKHQVYNIGSGRQVSVNQLIKIIGSLTNKEPRVTHIEQFKTFLKNSKVSTQRFSEEFNIQPKHSLQSGLKETLASN